MLEQIVIVCQLSAENADKLQPPTARLGEDALRVNLSGVLGCVERGADLSGLLALNKLRDDPDLARH